MDIVERNVGELKKLRLVTLDDVRRLTGIGRGQKIDASIDLNDRQAIEELIRKNRPILEKWPSIDSLAELTSCSATFAK